MIELESRVFPVFAVEELNECLIILIPAISCHLLQRMIEGYTFERYGVGLRSRLP
jgi:hypothetical protein